MHNFSKKYVHEFVSVLLINFLITPNTSNIKFFGLCADTINMKMNETVSKYMIYGRRNNKKLNRILTHRCSHLTKVFGELVSSKNLENNKIVVVSASVPLI